MKQTLNREFDLIKRFWVQMGWVKDIVVDAYIMINGEKKDEDEEWKGLTQTLRRIIAKLIDDLYVSTTKEITKVSNQLRSTNQEVKLVREEITATIANTNQKVE